MDQAQVQKRRIALEDPASLWLESILAGASGAFGLGGLALVPTIGGAWPWWGPTLGAGGAAILALRRNWPPQKTGVAMVIGAGALALPFVIPRWPWWAPVVGGAIGFAAGFCIGGVLILSHHRLLLTRFMWALELAAGRDLDKDGQIGQPDRPAPIRPLYVQPAGDAPQLPSGGQEEAPGPGQSAYDENADQDDRLDFGMFVAGIWPAPGRYNRGTSYRDWKGLILASGRRLSETRWREYMQRLLRCNLVRRRDSSPNAPYDVVVTDRAIVLQALREAIILPAEAGEQSLELPIG